MKRFNNSEFVTPYYFYICTQRVMKRVEEDCDWCLTLAGQDRAGWPFQQGEKTRYTGYRGGKTELKL